MNRLVLTGGGLVLSLSMLGCGSGPTRVDPGGQEKVTTMGVDYSEIVEWSDTLTQRMLQSGYLEAYQPFPVRMVVSDIQNQTNLSNFPREMMLGRIRASLLNSGKVRYVSTYGADGRDEMTRETRDLADDPMFENPEWNKPGGASVARLSLRTQILYHGARDGRTRQNTYEVRMFVTDVANGEVVWEAFSDPISKVSTKPVLSF